MGTGRSYSARERRLTCANANATCGRHWATSNRWRPLGRRWGQFKRTQWAQFGCPRPTCSHDRRSRLVVYPVRLSNLDVGQADVGEGRAELSLGERSGDAARVSLHVRARGSSAGQIRFRGLSDDFGGGRISALAASPFRISRGQVAHLPPVSRKVSANIRFFGYRRILPDSSGTVAAWTRCAIRSR